MQFCSSIFDVELPLDAFLFGVALVCPCDGLLAQFLNRTESTSFHTLGCQCTQLIFSNVQPASMFGCMAKLQSLDQRSRDIRFKRFIKRSLRMCIQVVTNQNDFFRIRKILFQENFHLMRPIIFRFLFADTHPSPTAKRVREHKALFGRSTGGCNACPFIFIIDSLGMMPGRGNRCSRFLAALFGRSTGGCTGCSSMTTTGTSGSYGK